MTTAGALFVFAIGLIIGSFLNVVIFRYNSGMKVTGRSKCFSCAHTLHWYELIPLVSFLVLQGRCRHCKSRLSLQYFMVELLTGIVFTLTVARLAEAGYIALTFASAAAFALSLLYLAAMAILIVISVYDLRHKIIPDGLAYAFAFLALLRIAAAFSIDPTYPWALDIASGALLSLFFVGLWYFSRGRWMGLGDGKLVLGMGWFLPFTENIAAVLVAFWGGAIVGIALLVMTHVMKRYSKAPMTMKSELPFAPFLIAGLFFVFLFDIDLATLVRVLQFIV